MPSIGIIPLILGPSLVMSCGADVCGVLRKNFQSVLRLEEVSL